MMNGYFGLSKREAEIYSFIFKLDMEWRPASDTDYKDVFSTSNRRLIIRECNINKTNLSRLIVSLRSRGLIVYNEQGGNEIPSMLAIDPADKIVETVFTFEVIDDEGAGQNN